MPIRIRQLWSVGRVMTVLLPNIAALDDVIEHAIKHARDYDNLRHRLWIEDSEQPAVATTVRAFIEFDLGRPPR